MDDTKIKDDSINNSIREIVGKNIKIGTKKFIRQEFKQDKYDNRLLCSCDFKVYILSLNKSNKPQKVEGCFNFLEVKRFDSPNKSQLTIITNDNKEYKLSNCDDNSNDIDEFIQYYCKTLRHIFPLISIKDLFESVSILPDKRWFSIETIYNEMDVQSKQNDLCGAYSRAYLCYCDLYSSSVYHEVGWDVNLIYSIHNLKEFLFNDFDYINAKDLLALISALRYNLWFESLNCEDIKLTNDIQDEISRVLSMPQSKLRSLSLIHCNLKSDFLQKLHQTLNQVKNNTKIVNLKQIFKKINLSRNSIEDRGALILSQMLKDFNTVDVELRDLEYLALSKCSLYSKGINSLFSSLKDYSTSLTNLDLSYNSLKDDPNELFRYLSEKNSLKELNLASTDIDLEKLLISLNKGCLSTLERLILSSNTNHSKSINTEIIYSYFQQSKLLNFIDFSNCKLTGVFVQSLFSGIQSNTSLNELHLNLSSNDLGSCLKSFSNEIGKPSGLTSLDLSENNFENEFDYVLNELRKSSIKHLCLSKNFVNIKLKYLKPIVNSLINLITKNCKIESLWLTDCKLKTHLNELLSILAACNTLKLLDISGNDIGDFGLNLLSKSLQVNCSIQNLSFDRSNVTYLAYNHLFDALKRNFTLKTIQIPMIDICNIYQKSPDRINDIVKQMNEIMLNRQTNIKKLQMEQFFKTKMRLIHEPHKNDDSSNQLDAKEIVQHLTETVTNYFSKNPIETQLNDFNLKINEKVNSITEDIEKKLNENLKEVYPKYFTNHINNNLVNGNAKLSNLKQLINEHLNNLFVQIHNEFCEVTYQMSLSMADKLIQSANLIEKEAHVSSPKLSPKSNKQIPQIPVDKNELSRFSFKSKSVRDKLSNESQQVSHRLDIKSKTKRPISTQFQTNIPSEPLDENIYMDIKDDIESNSSKSRDKTPEKCDNLNASDFVTELNKKSIQKEEKLEEIVPRPAPRSCLKRPKNPLTLRGDILVEQKEEFQPVKVEEKFKINTQFEEKPLETTTQKDSTSSSLNTSTDDLLSDDALKTSNENGSQLTHFNKNRAKRANVKKPTNVKTQISIETHDISENLEVKEIETVQKSNNHDDLVVKRTPSNELLKSNRQVDLKTTKTTAEQPAVSLDVLESIKLRKIVKNPAIDSGNPMVQSQLTSNTEPSTTTTQTQSPIAGLSRFGRHSCYVPSTKTNPLTTNLQLSKENLDEIKINRPPLRPPRPTVTATTNNTTITNENPLQFKLKPVKRDIPKERDTENKESREDNDSTEINKKSIRERIQKLTEETKKADSNN